MDYEVLDGIPSEDDYQEVDSIMKELGISEAKSLNDLYLDEKEEGFWFSL